LALRLQNVQMPAVHMDDVVHLICAHAIVIGWQMTAQKEYASLEQLMLILQKVILILLQESWPVQM